MMHISDILQRVYNIETIPLEDYAQWEVVPIG